jgi:hypothetical protein
MLRALVPYAMVAIVAAVIIWGLTRSGSIALVVGLGAGVTAAFLKIERANSREEAVDADSVTSYRELKQRLAREMGLNPNHIRVAARARALRTSAQARLSSTPHND